MPTETSVGDYYKSKKGNYSKTPIKDMRYGSSGKEVRAAEREERRKKREEEERKKKRELLRLKKERLKIKKD